MSGNDFVVNLSGTFHGSVYTAKFQNIGVEALKALPTAGEADRMKDLLEELDAALAALKPADAQTAEARDDVAAHAQDVVEKTKQPEPNKSLLRSALDGLGLAAQRLAAHAPEVVTFAGSIIELVKKAKGLG